LNGGGPAPERSTIKKPLLVQPVMEGAREATKPVNQGGLSTTLHDIVVDVRGLFYRLG